MRKLFFSTIILLLFCLSSQAQSCLPQGITFNSQAQIDNFPLIYGGCKEIKGPVSIGVEFSSNNITNLNGLSGITALDSTLTISTNTVLTNLNGLNNITSINQLFIHNNPALNSLSGLDNLTAITKQLSIANNQALTSLQGLGQLAAIGGEVMIIQNYLLSNVSALSKLHTVGGSFALNSSDALVSLNGLENLNQVVGHLEISNQKALTDISSLGNLTSIGGSFNLESNPVLSNVHGMEHIKTLGQHLSISNNAALLNLAGLDSLSKIGGGIHIISNPLLTDLDALEQVTAVGEISVYNNPGITSISGLKNITSTLGGLYIINCNSLTNLHGLENIISVAVLNISDNPLLTSLSNLGNITDANYGLNISNNPLILNLSGLEKLKSVGYVEMFGNTALSNLNALASLDSIGYLTIANNPALSNLNGLTNVTSVVSGIAIWNNDLLTNLNGLDHLSFATHWVSIKGNSGLTSLSGLESITDIRDTLVISGNEALTSLSSLSNLSTVRLIDISHNHVLSDCSIFAICDRLLNPAGSVAITDNAPGCNTPADVATMCHYSPVTVNVVLDYNGTQVPLVNMPVSLTGSAQMNLQPTDSNGTVHFAFLESGPFSIGLPQVPTGKWQRSESTVLLTSSMGTDSSVITLLLSPLVLCPELTTTLGMPAFFRGCLVNSSLAVSVQNSGTVLAEGAKVAVILPPGLELVSSVPLLSAQNGDTLYFEVGDLQAFETAAVQLVVKTACSAFVLGQTLCVETFSALDNPCPNTLPPASEIKLSAQCLGDTLLRFTLRNIGTAATQGWHTYKVIRNDLVSFSSTFQLNAQESTTVDVVADGATYRMEATKFDDGTETATALENCGGLTPGFITAFWLDKGSLEHDFDCRQVQGAYDPNLKSAVPTGFGWQYEIVANHPLEYTIDFQNTGTDTAFRVLLRDALPPYLDARSFRPGFASHPYTWVIRDQNMLEVLFSPISLPDSNVNEAASHGFFSFQIDQKPNLPNGARIQNTAAIIFDFNPPIVTNTVQHTIGQLTVQVDEPQAYATLWQVLGNPTREVAICRATAFIAGEKRFDLYDLSGQRVRSVQFAGQAFEFRRDGLNSGLYFFKIGDAQGRVFAGKIVVTD